MKKIEIKFIDGTGVTKLANNIMQINKNSIEFIDDKGIYQEHSTKGFNTGKPAVITITEYKDENDYIVVIGKNTGNPWCERKAQHNKTLETIFKDELTQEEAEKIVKQLATLKGE